MIAVALALIAQFVPIEVAMKLGSFSLKIDSSLVVLGRVLIIQPAEGSLLALIYGAAALWFFGAEASKTATRLVPMGFMIIALMVAAIAVQPFLYAALFIEMAILIAIPVLMPAVQQLGIDPVHFGLIVVLNLMIGLLHPPMGMVLFVLARVARMSLERTTMAILPWLVPLLGSLILITYVPIISLWLPKIFYR